MTSYNNYKNNNKNNMTQRQLRSSTSEDTRKKDGFSYEEDSIFRYLMSQKGSLLQPLDVDDLMSESQIDTKKPAVARKTKKRASSAKKLPPGFSKGNGLAFIAVSGGMDCLEHVLSFLDNPVDVRNATMKQRPAILRNSRAINYRVVVPALAYHGNTTYGLLLRVLYLVDHGSKWVPTARQLLFLGSQRSCLRDQHHPFFAPQQPWALLQHPVFDFVSRVPGLPDLPFQFAGDGNQFNRCLGQGMCGGCRWDRDLVHDPDELGLGGQGCRTETQACAEAEFRKAMGLITPLQVNQHKMWKKQKNVLANLERFQGSVAKFQGTDEGGLMDDELSNMMLKRLPFRLSTADIAQVKSEFTEDITQTFASAVFRKAPLSKRKSDNIAEKLGQVYIQLDRHGWVVRPSEANPSDRYLWSVKGLEREHEKVFVEFFLHMRSTPARLMAFGHIRTPEAWIEISQKLKDDKPFEALLSFATIATGDRYLRRAFINTFFDPEISILPEFDEVVCQAWDSAYENRESDGEWSYTYERWEEVYYLAKSELVQLREKAKHHSRKRKRSTSHDE